MGILKPRLLLSLQCYLLVLEVKLGERGDDLVLGQHFLDVHFIGANEAFIVLLLEREVREPAVVVMIATALHVEVLAGNDAKIVRKAAWVKGATA